MTLIGNNNLNIILIKMTYVQSNKSMPVLTTGINI